MALEVTAVVPVPEPAAAPQLLHETASERLQPQCDVPAQNALTGAGAALLPPLEELLPAMALAAAAMAAVPAAAPAAAKAAAAPAAAKAVAEAKPAAAAPPAPAGYSSDTYWDGRYAGEHKQRIEHFDWFFCYTALDALINRACQNKQLPCLHVGCGNSDLSQGMAANGSYRHIVNVDISAVVIKQMQAAQDHAMTAAVAAAAAAQADGEHRDQSVCPRTPPNEVAWEVADCRAMPQFESGSFGCVIDKGTLDAVLCSASGAKDVGAYVREVHRLLAPGGAFLLITLGRPIARLGVLSGEVRQPGSTTSTINSSNGATNSSTSRTSSGSCPAVAGEAAAQQLGPPAPLEWASIEVLLLPKPDAYMASEASIMGRPYLGRKNSGKADSVHKFSPVQWMGPFSPQELEAQVAEQQLDLQEYFFAYIASR